MRYLRPTSDPQRPNEDLVGCCSLAKMSHDKQERRGIVGNLTGQRALDAVEVGEAVGPLGGGAPRGGGPQVGLQTVEGRQAAVILDTRQTRRLG